MQKLLDALSASFPDIRFTPGKTFCWSPESGEVFYNANSDDARGRWSLLHETGHALLGHNSYIRDVELIKLEVAAWNKARQLAKRFDLTIDEDHIQDCLDTYRDWLDARALCPGCATKCLQQDDPHCYRCHNCHTTWRVTPARFARAYRSVKNTPQTAQQVIPAP